MDIKIDSSWKLVLKEEFDKTYFQNLINFVKQEYAQTTCYPPAKLLFNAFDSCSFDDVKVVILGQDPYHGPNQAHGLCFSVNDGVPLPPSLKNIFKEQKDDLGKEIPDSGNLQAWANQGVLLLNATLSVRAGQAASHQKKGWETFTDAAIDHLNKEKEGLVFMLWGNYAQNKGKLINDTKHLVLKARHPSPLAANFGGWFGQKHFSQCNTYLKNMDKTPINW
ncbi:uracil-DNA glycosylase [Arcticibacterium luteifluviistationis]|uniref:Uracil-DNA glycosylase n=1 Tax=Arcticibacterium luteifluviistationis TaxID=1784714 RepID=A0A2Z4G810_9BACT|nr:uracil-DNA glycosylase [Arcticibacterium luteifluviistationis]AWV97312.1 uracil-DNA glycosylase [Arcticibacterium luteifluviistationis]